jgi:hypothetical protein
MRHCRRCDGSQRAVSFRGKVTSRHTLLIEKVCCVDDYVRPSLSRSIATSADDSRNSGKLLMAFAAASSVPMDCNVYLLRRQE